MNTKTWITGYRPAGVPYVEQFKNLLLSRSRSLHKMVELLHLQLLRKGRARDRTTFYHPVLKQNVYFFGKYDIKSPDPSPYNYHSGKALGLNQYFVGQSPYRHYNGNLKDGIYHDECDIIAGSKIKGASITGVIRYTYETENSHTTKWHTGYDDSPWFLRDNDGNKVLMSKPKYFLENEKFSLIYKVTREAPREIGDNFEVISFNYTYYTKVYKQTSGQFAIDTGETSSFTINQSKLQDYINSCMSIKQIHSYGDITIKHNGENARPDKHISYWNHADVATSGEDLQVSFTDANSGVNYTLYPVGIGPAYQIYPEGTGYYIMFHDGRVGKFTTRWNDHNLYLELVETFYSSNDMPTRGSFKWFKEWLTHYKLHIEEDKHIPGFVAPLVAIAAVVASIFIGPAAAAGAQTVLAASMSATAVTIASTAAGVGAVAGIMGLALSVIGGINGDMGLVKFGKILGITGAILSVYSAVTQIWARLGATAISSASALSSSSVASANGLSQTASLYTTTGSANASALGSNLVTSSALPGGFSMVSGNSGTFIISSSGLATNVSTGATMAITGSNTIFSGMSSVNVFTSNITISSITGGNMLYSPVTANALMPSVFTGSSIGSSQSLNILGSFKDLYKAYSNTRDIFKSPNKYADDEMPSNDDEPKINFIPMNTELIKRKNYSISEDYDLGLEKGTLMYLPSVREKIKLIERTQNG